MGFKLKNVVRAVTQPARQAVKTVQSVAKGDLKGAVKNAVGAVAAGNPVTMANNATGGLGAQVAGAIPLVGSSASKFVASGSDMSDGQFSGSTLRTYVREGAKLGALVAGGVYAAPALGISGTTAVTTASALSKGNFSGAASSLAGADAFEGFGDLIPEDLSSAGKQVGGLVDWNSFFSSGGGSRAPASSEEPAAIIAATSRRAPGLSSTEKMILGGAAAALALLLILKRKGK